ncbi:MAG TPA: SDR family NAD(P)-dependent oxidoreductase [Polyangiaceae bacterium]|nr:SDR family NAD(P)-dependent oxidoreductase [Polyangiaceae bacterium]
MPAPRVAVVTGANRGIGAEIARELESEGFQVVRTSRRSPAGSAPARASALPGEYVTLDVTKADQIEALARSTAAGLDVLVNNAGVLLDGLDADVARRTLDVNFYGPMRVTDALLPAIRPGGRVIMVSSGMGDLSGARGEAHARMSDPRLTRAQLVDLVELFVRDVAGGEHSGRGWPSSAYSVSKMALNALVRVLARELEGDPRAVRVNAVCPGWVRTRMGGPSAPRSVEQGARTVVWLATMPEGVPTGGYFRDERPIPW